MLNEKEEIYISNIMKWQVLMSPNSFSNITEANEIIQTLHERTYQVKDLKAVNDDILEEVVYKYKKDPSLLTREIAGNLEEFSDTLFKRFLGIETGTCYDIMELLLPFAQSNYDPSSLIRIIYKIGMAYYYSRPSYVSSEVPYFSMVFKYIDNYFSLTKDGRRYFCRSLGNCVIGNSVEEEKKKLDELLRLNDRAVDFFMRRDVQELDPEFPFNTWIFSMKMNASTLTAALRGEEVSATPEQKEKIYAASKYVYDHAYEVFNTQSTSYAQAIIEKDLSSFHVGHTTIEQMLKQLEDEIVINPNDPYSSESFYRQVKITGYYFEYLANYSNMTPEDKLKKMLPMFEKTVAYIKKSGGRMENKGGKDSLLAFIYTSMSYLPFEKIKEQIFNLTIYCHLPTYIHSLMVKEFTSLLTSAMLKKNPAFFVGMERYKTLEDVKKNAKEIQERLSDAARLHDLGKYSCFQIINDDYRKLTEEELATIKMHPKTGYIFSCFGFKGQQPHDKIIVDVIHYHHLWHNHQGGYILQDGPGPDNDQAAIDIVSVADSLDAGTDNIGRAYSYAKDVDGIIADIQKDEGTRYSKEVCDLLADPDVKKRIRDKIEIERTQIYINCYKHVI
jgi:HD-GYP domain-containing protein (c-di-GMP phosphodiesterase class II)